MRSINVTLPDDLSEFLNAEASAGGFEDPADYVRQILRALWKEKAKEELEAKLVAAAESGPAIEATPQFWADLRARVHARAKATRP